jgi:Glutamine amidotransferases class-II
VCEILAIRSAEPFRLGSLLALAEPLDAWGDTGFGWGVAWLEPDADRVRLYKRPLALMQDSAPYAAIGDRYARVAFIHLRAPSDMSTVDVTNTHPWLLPSGCAFAHNGFLPRHDELRPRFVGRYAGRVDSEIGALLFEDLQQTMDPAEALVAVHRELGGDRANLVSLYPDGRLYFYSSHVGNLTYALRHWDRDVLVTSMHRTDDVLVRKLFPGAEGLRLLERGEVVAWPPVARPEAVGAAR